LCAWTWADLSGFGDGGWHVLEPSQYPEVVCEGCPGDEALLGGPVFGRQVVAKEVGFEDADYFRACFKRTYGMTPREFAENSGS
jgi:hypothetical protein